MNQNYKIFMLLGYVKAKIEELSMRCFDKESALTLTVTDFEAYFNKSISDIFEEGNFGD